MRPGKRTFISGNDWFLSLNVAEGLEAALAELVEPSSLSGGRYANRSSSCIAVCWPIVRDDDVCRRLMTVPGVGESDRTGGISRYDDEMMRVMLYEAAQVMLVRSTR